MTYFKLFLLSLLCWWGSTAFGQITGTPDPGYCAGGNTAGSASGVIAIRNVLFNEIYGPNGLYTDGYANLNSVFGKASIIQGQMHHLSVQDGNGGTNPRRVSAWIDYNGDGIFDDATERIVGPQQWSSGNGNVISGYFNVPTNAVVGNTKMRVRIKYGSGVANNPVPCGNITGNGQTFDYDVEIKPSISPIAPPVVFDGGNIVSASGSLVHITNVSLGNINNNSLYFGTSAAGYNYSNYTGQYVTSLTSGQTYTMSVTKSNYIATIGVWIDWNNDGDFTDAGEEVYKQYIGSNNTINFNITPPAGIPHNTETMMRVRVVYDNVASVLTPTNYSTLPAGNSRNNNETEDYRVLLINSGCAVVAGTASINSSNLSCNNTVTLSLTGNGPGTIQWLQSTDNTNFSPIVGADNTPYTTGALNANTTYYFRAEVSDGSCANPSNTVSINTLTSYLHSSNSNQNITTCSGVYRDAGGTANYPLNFGGTGGSTTTTFYPCTPGQKLELDFSFLNTDNYGTCGAYHFIRIYDGNSTSAPLIGCYYGSQNPGVITSTASDGSLTIQFGTDTYNSNNSGWEATISCISPPALVCAPVTNLSAAIGSPANGTQHHLNVTWDALTGATGYDLEYSTSSNSGPWTSLGTVTGTSYDFNAGDSPNTPYYFRIRAKDGSQTCAWATMSTPRYTAADVPAIPSLSNVGSTIDVTLPNETPVNNPASTTYSIKDENTGLFVQANGTLGATEVFRTKAQWGTVTVNGLSSNTQYCFVAKARNNDGHEVGGSGATLLAAQGFNTSGTLSTTGGSGSTATWWSPSSCGSGGLTWNASNGCTGGAVGQSTTTPFCLLRSPAINCTGQNTVVMTFDISHSYFASLTTDQVNFNMWAPTASAPTGQYIDAAKVNGVAGDILYFDQPRSCQQITVEYDLSLVTDKSAILFYFNTYRPGSSSNTYYMWVDNVKFSEATQTACATTTTCVAGTWTGLAGDNDWNNPANWSCNTIPTASIDVSIPAGVSTYPILATALGNPTIGYVRDITIAANANITISGGGNTLEVNRNLTNNGAANLGAGALRLTNSATHTVNGNINIGTLTVEANTAINDVLNISEALNLVAGVLNTNNGTVTLKSNATTTAYIDDFSAGHSGSINGNVTVERYVANTVNGFHYVGTPVNGANFGDWAADFTMYGSNNAQVIPQANCDPNALAQGSPYGGLFDYRENTVTDCYLSGWHVRNGNGNISRAQGFAGIIPNGRTIDLTGTANTGPINSGPLTRSAQNLTSTQGMHLISNPYPSALDWYDVAAANSGIDGTAYLWLTSGGYQGTYQPMNALAPNSSFIGSSQGFFVEALSNGTQVNFNNTMRVTGNNSFLRQGQAFDSRLILEVSGNGYNDMTIVAFGTDFTHGYDRDFDGKKMQSKAGVMTLYTHTNTSYPRQSTNALPNDRSVKVVPVGFAAGANGTFTFNATDLGTFAPGTLIFLEDLKTGHMQNLMLNAQYTFQGDKTDGEARFLLHFIPGIEWNTVAASCIGNDGSLVVDLGASQINGTVITWDNYEIVNQSGNEIATGHNANGTINLNNLAPGTYTVTLEHDGYTVVQDITITGAPLVDALVAPSDTEVIVGEIIAFTNTSQGASSYAWDFGDGNTSTDANPAYSYTAEGTYTVILTATNGTCTDMFTQTIIVAKVQDPTGITELADGAGLQIFGYGRTITVRFENWKDGEAQLELYDLTGRKVIDTQTLNTAQAEHRVNVDEVVTGYYFVHVTGASGSQVTRVFLGE